MERQIIVKGISKKFGKGKSEEIALRDVDISVNKGEFIVIAGHNGSGKSTLLKCIIGLLLPEVGDINVLGIDVKKDWKKLSPKIGVVLSSDRSLYYKLTPEENLKIFGGIYGVSKEELKESIPKLLKYFDLYEHRKKLVETFSTGMKKKIMIAKALIHNPKIILADELFNGLDAKAIADLMEHLIVLNDEGVTILLVSHILHDLPDRTRILFLNQGQLILDENIRNLAIKESIKIKYKVDSEYLEASVPKKDLALKIQSLVNDGIVDIDIKNEDIYDISKRYF